MDRYIERLNQYLKKDPFDCGQRDCGSVLDYITDCYLEDNPIDDKAIREIQAELSPYYENIPLAASERLFVLIYSLCGAYESAAFRTGIQVGAHLQRELESIN